MSQLWYPQTFCLHFLWHLPYCIKFKVNPTFVTHSRWLCNSSSPDSALFIGEMTWCLRFALKYNNKKGGPDETRLTKTSIYWSCVMGAWMIIQNFIIKQKPSPWRQPDRGSNPSFTMYEMSDFEVQCLRVGIMGGPLGPVYFILFYFGY